MQKKLTVTGIAILLLAGGVLLLATGVDRYRGQLQAALAERLGRDVSLGRIDLSVVPLGLRVQQVAIADDPGFQSERPFAQVEALYLSPRVLPLLRGRFELSSLELRRPAIELVRNPAGVWNFSTLGGSETGQATESPLVLNRLVITSGQVGLTDHQRRQGLDAKRSGTNQRAVYRNIDVQLDDYTPDRAFDVVLAATFPGAGAERLSVRGTAGPVVPDDVAGTPFTGAVQFDAVSISGLLQFLDVEALEGTDSVISGRADLSNRDGRLTSQGSLQLTDTRAGGVELGYPITAGFDLAHDLGTGLLTITSGTLRLDETPLSITGTLNLQPETPTLDVHVTASEVSLSETARLASAFGVAFGADTDVQGRLNADVRARGPADRPALEGRLRLRDVTISGADIPRPVRTQAVDLTLSPTEVRSNEFAVTTNDTSLIVRVAVSRYTTEAPAVDASVRTTSADFGEVLNVARAWGVTAVDGVSGTGRLTLNVRATGPTDALRYSGAGSLAEATLKTPSIAQPLRVRNAGVTFSSDAASLERLSVSVGKTTATGSVTVRNFAAPQVKFQLSADAIDVADMQAWLTPAGTQQPQQGQTDESMLLHTTGSGTVRVGSITQDQLVLENVQANATIDRGLIRLDPLTAAVFGGRHRGAIAVDARRTPTTFNFASSLEQVDANRLASATTNLRDVIYGALSSDVRLSASSDGAEEMARSLNGTLSLNVSDGRIANMDLIHEIAAIGRFLAGTEAARRSTPITALTGHFAVTDGLARTDDLKASIEGGTLGASGSVNLVDQSVNLRLTAVLSRDYSQRVGGTRIGGFMATVLSNQQGELVVPVLVTGTLQQPRFAPDAQRIAEMKLRNLVPNLRNPQQLTTGLLGAITAPAEEGRTPKKALEDVVGAITGRGTEQPPEKQPKDEVAPAPERKDPVQRLQDRLKGLLGGRQQKEEKPPTTPSGAP